MGNKSEMASTSAVGNIQKASDIQRATLCYIFPRK